MSMSIDSTKRKQTTFILLHRDLFCFCFNQYKYDVDKVGLVTWSSVSCSSSPWSSMINSAFSFWYSSSSLLSCSSLARCSASSCGKKTFAITPTSAVHQYNFGSECKHNSMDLFEFHLPLPLILLSSLLVSQLLHLPPLLALLHLSLRKYSTSMIDK